MFSELTYQKAYVKLLARIRQARLDAELTQEEVASLLGRPQSFVSKVESGERRLDFVELLILARIYQKQISYFQVDFTTE